MFLDRGRHTREVFEAKKAIFEESILKSANKTDLLLLPDDALWYLLMPQRLPELVGGLDHLNLAVEDKTASGLYAVINYHNTPRGLRERLLYRKRIPLEDGEKLIEVYISKYSYSLGEVLSVGPYRDHRLLRRKGVATSFYQKLHRCAKEMGFWAVSGTNNSENLSFFTDKLGRIALPNLPQEIGNMIFPNRGSMDAQTYKHMFNHTTLLFLNDSDRKKYVGRNAT